MPANEGLNIQPPFAISVLMSFVAFGVVTKLYLWPWLQTRRRNEALLALVVPHVPLDARMLGAALFIPTAIVPPLLITHALVFRLLVGKDAAGP